MHLLRFFLTLTQFRTLDVPRHDVAFVCSSSVSDLSPDLAPTLLPLFAAAHAALARLPPTHSQSSRDPDCRSNPIAHRVRRKRQRLPPSLLIENASDQHLSNLKCPARGVSDQG